jgi:hypothetical protein
MHEESQNMSQLADESLEHMANFSKMLDLFNEDALQTAEDAKALQNVFLISLIQIDHSIFKSATYSVAMQNNPEYELPSHTACNFGKWYNNSGAAQFGHLPLYSRLEAPHKTVHDMGLKTLEYVKNGTIYDPKNAADVVNNFKLMEEASNLMSEILNELIDRKSKNHSLA